MSASFRFQTLDIWKRAVEIGDLLLDIADDLERRKLYRFADQVRGAALSVSNNIAEGSGSISDKDYSHFLNIARRSAFENANMAIVFTRRGLISESQRDALLELIDTECKMISAFSSKLRNRAAAKALALTAFFATVFTSLIVLFPPS